MKPRYMNKAMQRCFDAALLAAADSTSEFYFDGQQHRGAGHRCAFWDGFNGLETSANVVPGTISWVFFQAGKEWARKQIRVAGAA